MKFWCSVSFLPFEALIDLARTCEEAGFDGVMVADHLVYPERLESSYPYAPDGVPPWEPANPWPDPWVAIGAMAAVTTQIRFSTNIFIAPARHPLVVAKSVATAAALSGGRVALGAGVGWMAEEFAAAGQDFHTRGRRLDEMITILRALWTGQVVEYHGRFYSFDRLSISPVPEAPIPIYTGGDSDAALRRAACVDGWVGSLYGVDDAEERIATVRKVRADLGREPDDDYEIFVALRARPDDVDAYRRIADAGATSVMCAPCHVVPPEERTSERLRSEVLSFAERVLTPIRNELS